MAGGTLQGPQRRLRCSANTGITHKALTEALRRLERNGLVCREVLDTSPVAVEYSITELGRTLQTPFAAVYEWSINHLDDIERAQAEYDKRIGRQ